MHQDLERGQSDISILFSGFVAWINRAPQPVPPALQEKIDEAIADSGMELGGIIPSSDVLINQELSGESYLGLDDSADVVVTVNEIFDRIFS